MALRDDLMVVIPDRLFGGIMDKGTFYDGYKLSTRSVSSLRKMRETWEGAQPHVKQWLKTFETDPETVIVVPATDWHPSIRASLGELRENRTTVREKYAHLRHKQPEWHAFLDTFETVEPTEPSFDPLIKVPAGIVVDLMAVEKAKPASWSFCPFCKEPIAEQGEDIQYLSGPYRGPMHSSCEELSTRLERVAAGLEEPIETAHIKERCGKHAIFPIYDDIGIASGGTSKVPAFSLRPPKPTLTIEPDPADGDDVCADATSDRYFGVKR